MFTHQPFRPGAWVCGECLAPCPEAWVCRGCGTLLCPKCDAKPHTHPAGDRAGKPCAAPLNIPDFELDLALGAA